MGFFKLFSRMGPRKATLFSSASAFLLSATLTLSPSFSAAVANEHNSQVQNKFKAGVKVIPHDTKLAKGGEDAFLITEDMVGVADGVGGWSQYGIDAGLYSRALCENIKNIHLSSNRIGSAPFIKKPLKQIIIEAAMHTVLQGSTTLVLALVDPSESVLHTANFGDSGYMLLRKEEGKVKMLFRSKEMQKSFNYPYQIGYRTNGDDPSLSEINQHQVKTGDVIILGTDGCFDNLFDEDIMQIIEPVMLESDTLKQPAVVAQAIARKAYEFSKNLHRQSPFGKNSGNTFSGGKQDDITVLVAQIELKSQVRPDDL